MAEELTTLAASISAAGGIKKWFRKGIPEYEVVVRVKKIIDAIAASMSEGGKVSAQAQRAIALVGMSVQMTLPQLGLSDNAVRELLSYGTEKFGGIVPA